MLKPDTFVSVDVETTGLDAQLHEIIEVGAVKVVNGTVAAEYSQLVKPLKPLPDFITHLTGISAADLKHAPPIRDAMPPFLDFVSGFKIVGQNIGFDIGFLRAAAGMGNFSNPIDTVEFARVLLPMLPSYNLDSLIEFFALEPEKRHRALEDARVTAQVYLKLLGMLRVFPDGLLAEMNALSSRTGSSLAEVFEAHLMERIEHPTAFRGPAHIPDARMAGPDNMFGDFSGDIPDFGETGGFVDENRMEDVLRAGGALSRVHEDFEERPGQIALARRMVRAFNDAEIFLAEAGTGTGKSIAYLAPSVLFAESAHERVVVSTNTKNLQEQLFYKDIPLLARMLDFGFRAVILKGRGNYICLTRWKRLIETPDQYLTRQERALVLPVAAWLHTTTTGDLSETGFFPMLAETGLLERINSEPVSCLGPRCRHRDRCFVNRIRNAARRAHIVIVNHSLVFSDMVSEGAVLGMYARIVFDEAHNLEKVAMRYLGVTLTYSRIRRILNRLYTKSEGNHGILAALESWAKKAVEAWPDLEAKATLVRDAQERVHSVRSRSQEFFQRVNASVSAASEREGDSGLEGKLRYYHDSPIFRENEQETESFRQSVGDLIGALDDLALSLAGVSPGQLSEKEETLLDIEKTKIDLQAVIADLEFLVTAEGRNVFWFEFDEDEGSSRFVRIQSAPLDVAEKLAGGLYDRMETVIMTSATLTVANDFSYIRGRLGLDLDHRDRVTEFIAASPFDHHRQAAVIVPSHMPSPKEADFIERTNEVVLALADGVRRGMLVLFTSRGHLQRSYNDLRDDFSRRGITLLAQGFDGSRNAILRRFREDVSSVLFGMDSFWEGVDVPGKALEIVVIVRLPFAVPTDPIVQAQIEEIERTGRNAFTGYSVPEAAIKLRQGAGRLIRHRNDRGAVIVLDSRMATARYGGIFKRSLPGRMLRADSPEMLVETLKLWFAEENGASDKE